MLFPYFLNPFYRNISQAGANMRPYGQNNGGTGICTNKDFNPVSECCEESNCNEQDQQEDREFFEIMGIKLYFDDILIICLLFFLYTEDVQDEWLFIALILLLLS